MIFTPWNPPPVNSDVTGYVIAAVLLLVVVLATAIAAWTLF